MPLSESEKATLRKGALVQLQSFSEVGIDILPKKYWAEYAECFADAGKPAAEITVDDIIGLLNSKRKLFAGTLTPVYGLLVAEKIVKELEEKYKDEWPKEA